MSKETEKHVKEASSITPHTSVKSEKDYSPLSDLSLEESSVKGQSEPRATAKEETKSKGKKEEFLDPEADEEEPADEGELKEAFSRPPPVNSSYLPLPWKGRLGYVGDFPYFKRIQMKLIFVGLSLHISSLLKSSRVQFTYMSNCLDS